jgi:hypothetical protein
MCWKPANNLRLFAIKNLVIGESHAPMGTSGLSKLSALLDQILEIHAPPHFWGVEICE